MIETEDFTFDSPQGHQLAATKVICDKTSPTALLLHGAGPADRHYLRYIADHLANQDIGSLRFDFSGWGASGGDRGQQSLDKRVAEANAACAYLQDKSPSLITGSSMSGHIVCRLLETHNPEHVVLFCPAAYAAEADEVNFTNFTAIIRQPESWKSARIFPLLKRYQGKVTLIIGSNDVIIPPGVIEMYEAACRNAEFRKIVIPNAPHALNKWLPLPENSDYRRKVLAAIA